MLVRFASLVWKVYVFFSVLSVVCVCFISMPILAYALHILNNRHEYGTAEETLELLEPCNKRTRMNC
jgi:hypothetical protein